MLRETWIESVNDWPLVLNTYFVVVEQIDSSMNEYMDQQENLGSIAACSEDEQ